MKKSFVPLFASVWVFAVGLTLLLVTTLRPWSTSDKEWDTHLNFRQEAPGDYTRTEVGWVGLTSEVPAGWEVHEGVRSSNEGEVLFVARGCAACHGIEGDGSGAGPSVLGASQRVITRVVRSGPGGMPAYASSGLSDEEMVLITQYIASLGAAPTPTPFMATPTATPWPRPTATPTQTPVPTATPAPTPTLAPGVTPSPTPIATATPVPSPTASPTPTAASSQGDIAAGKQLYSDVGCSSCHGADAKGATLGPSLIGLSLDKIKDAVRNGAKTPGSKYSSPMPAFSQGDLTDAELNQIIQYLLSLK